MSLTSEEFTKPDRFLKRTGMEEGPNPSRDASEVWHWARFSALQKMVGLGECSLDFSRGVELTFGKCYGICTYVRSEYAPA